MNGSRRWCTLRRGPGGLRSGATAGVRAADPTWTAPSRAPVLHLATAPVRTRRDRRTEPRLRV